MPKPKVNGEYGDSLRRHVVFFVVVRVGFLRPDVADVGFVDFLVATLAFFEAGVGSGWAPAAASAAKSLEGTFITDQIRLFIASRKAIANIPCAFLMYQMVPHCEMRLR